MGELEGFMVRFLFLLRNYILEIPSHDPLMVDEYLFTHTFLLQLEGGRSLQTRVNAILFFENLKNVVSQILMNYLVFF